MKKILFIFIAILISITANANKVYIATAANGGNNANPGTLAQPWLTLAYACTQAVAGDTIMIAAGTYNEGTNLMNKPVGVSIMGVMSGSDTTHIISTNQSTSEYEAAITCKSTTGISTYDNSSISYIKLTGSNLTAFQGIYIGYRSGIKIHNCVIKDFFTNGIGINSSMTSYPNLYLTGIEIYNNVIKNCAGWATLGGVPDASSSSIRIRGTDGIKIHDNLFDNRSRPTGENGETIGLYRNKNHQIYNNTFYRNNHEVTSGGTRRWNFFVEEWNYRGNGQFYNNTLYGLAQFSIGGDDNLVTSGCSYGYKIYGNQFLNPANGNKFNNGTEVTLYAICVEGGGHNLVEVYKNYIQRYAVGVEISTPTSDPAGFWKESWIMENVKVHYNIIENIGYADNKYGALGIWLINETMVSPYYNTFNNILIANNVITGDNGGTYRGYAGIYVNINGNWTELNIHNNIATGFSERGIYIYEHSTDGLNLSNSNATYNLMYNNTTSNLVYIENTINQTNVDVTSGNLTSDPLFVGGSPYSYKLQSTSPARDAGISVGLTSDYGGYSVPVGSAPDIGAWEYGADITPPNWTPQGIGWDRMYQKLNFRDSINFTRGFMIAGVPISASGSGLEILGGLTASVDDLNATAGATGNFQGQINSIVASTVDDSKADTSLSNLASVAINTHLLPGTDGAVNLGSATYKWGNIFIDSAKYVSWNNGDITATHSDQTLTFAGGNIVLPSTTSIGSVSSTEIGYVNNVTSAIQTQLNSAETRIDSIVTVLADTVNIETLLQIDFDTDTVASLSDVRSLAGSGMVGVTLNSGTLTLTGDAGTADDITFYTNGDGSYNLPAGGGNLTIMSEVQGWINDSLDKAKVDIRKFDSDTIPLFVFGLGSGHSTDTALFNNGRLAGAFYNSGSDTLYVTELRGVLVEGTGTETIDVQVSWHANMRDVSAVNLNTSAITINNMTTGTSDVSFNNNGIPPGQWVWCVLSGASSGNKPTALMLTMTGYRRNRSY